LATPVSTPPLNDVTPMRDDLRAAQRRRSFSVWVDAALLLAMATGSYLWWSSPSGVPATRYLTEAVARGDLSIYVIASGTLQPTRIVNIGSELSGTVTRVLVDVNDRVRKGQVLVEIDKGKFRDLVSRSRATLASNVAKAAQTATTLKETQANLARLKEVARLSGGKVPSVSELDTAQATLERARADEAIARASVADAKAALSTDETNLGTTSIRAPSDGVVLTRSVDAGNAVAASLQAVTLFTIAEDLTSMKLQIRVDEADMGKVAVGQTASITVSAYPTRKYQATITRLANGSNTIDNVVTDVANLAVDNTDMSLRPGMTATATINTTQRHDVLLVPNAALRFTPLMQDAFTRFTTRLPGGGGGFVDSLLPHPPGMIPPSKTAMPSGVATGGRQVWILIDGRPSPLAVTSGVSDGKLTEITSSNLRAGLQVIVDQNTAANN
jgi:HlyD family secretion protein